MTNSSEGSEITASEDGAGPLDPGTGAARSRRAHAPAFLALGALIVVVWLVDVLPLWLGSPRPFSACGQLVECGRLPSSYYYGWATATTLLLLGAAVAWFRLGTAARTDHNPSADR